MKKRIGFSRILAVLLAFVMTAGLTMGVFAAAPLPFIWTGEGADDYWTNPDNWDADGGYPSAGDTVLIDGDYADILLDEDVAIAKLDVQDWTMLRSTEDSFSTLTVDELVVDQDFMLWDIILNITGGAANEVASRLENAGDDGFGWLGVFGGAEVKLSSALMVEEDGHIYLAGEAGAPGTFTVEEDGFLLNLGEFCISYAGPGALYIEPGGWLVDVNGNFYMQEDSDDPIFENDGSAVFLAPFADYLNYIDDDDPYTWADFMAEDRCYYDNITGSGDFYFQQPLVVKNGSSVIDDYDISFDSDSDEDINGAMINVMCSKPGYAVVGTQPVSVTITADGYEPKTVELSFNWRDLDDADYSPWDVENVIDLAASTPDPTPRKSRSSSSKAKENPVGSPGEALDAVPDSTLTGVLSDAGPKVFLKLSNSSQLLKLDSLRSLASRADANNKTVLIHNDKKAANGAVLFRQYINPADAKKDVKLGAALTPNAALGGKTGFKIEFDEKDGFGSPMRYAIRLTDAGLAGGEFEFWYQDGNGNLVKFAPESITVGADGYLYFKMEKAGTILITPKTS